VAIPGFARLGKNFVTWTTNNADSDAKALPYDVVAGNLIVVGVACWRTTANTSIGVTDDRSTSYSTLLASTGVAWGGGTGKPAIAYGVAGSSGACTITINPNDASNYWRAFAMELDDTNATPLDVNGGESTGTSTAPSDSLTTLVNQAFVIGVAAYADGVVTLTPDAPNLQLDEDETAGQQPYGVAGKILATAGATSVAWTLGGSKAWSVYTASFAPVASGGGGGLKLVGRGGLAG
jgi:hypothetical protein